MPGKGRRVDTSDFLKDILEFHTQDVHSWLITCNKQKKGMKGNETTKKAAVQLLLLAAAMLMVCYGAMRGEAATVLSKAIKLCLECVGIG